MDYITVYHSFYDFKLLYMEQKLKSKIKRNIFKKWKCFEIVTLSSDLSYGKLIRKSKGNLSYVHQGLDEFESGSGFVSLLFYVTAVEGNENQERLMQI